MGDPLDDDADDRDPPMQTSGTELPTNQSSDLDRGQIVCPELVAPSTTQGLLNDAFPEFEQPHPPDGEGPTSSDAAAVGVWRKKLGAEIRKMTVSMQANQSRSRRRVEQVSPEASSHPSGKDVPR